MLVGPRADHLRPEGGADIRDPRDVVVMVVRDQHQIAAPASRLQRLHHRPGLWHIDNSDLARRLIAQQIGVIVGPAGYGHDVQGHGTGSVGRRFVMHQDVVDLRGFYYRTKLGRIVQRVLQEALTAYWPDTSHMTVAGFGFAAPFLRPFLATSRRVICLMPGQQGVMPWPQGQPNHSVLVQETNWPLSAASVDRLIVAHALETCERADALIAEVHRVLAPDGKAIFVVPNRAGMWARRETTPFGHGHPYTTGQVERLLRKHNFLPERHTAALYIPPSQKRFWLRTDRMWEGAGTQTRRPDAGRRPDRGGVQTGLRHPPSRLARPRPRPARGAGGADQAQSQAQACRRADRRLPAPQPQRIADLIPNILRKASQVPRRREFAFNLLA